MQDNSERSLTPMDLTSLQPGDAVIADSNRVNAESIAWCLKAYGGFRNVTAVSTAAELIQTVRLGETRVAVFGDGLTDRQMDLIVNNRVTGILSREDAMKKISEQLSQISGGQTVLSEQLAARVQLSRDGHFRCSASTQMQKLTDRQWDVLLKIAEGRRVSEVAEALAISEKAVESHKYRIMRAVGATDRVDLCRWAIREGLIEA